MISKVRFVRLKNVLLKQVEKIEGLKFFFRALDKRDRNKQNWNRS